MGYAASSGSGAGYATSQGPDAGNDYGKVNNPPSVYGGPDTPQVSGITSGLGNGVNLQPSYDNNGDVDLGWDLMKKNPKIKAVRIEIEAAVKMAIVKRWIQEAVAGGYQVIATYHDHTCLGSDDAAKLQTAATWWESNYAALKSAGDFTINVMNEWGSAGITPFDFASSYNKALGVIRKFYAGPVIIDIPGYGQATQIAYQAIKNQSTTRITDTKLILSMHIYDDSGQYRNNKWQVLQNGDLDELASTGLGCMVGEFGSKIAGTPAPAVVDYARSRGWPVFGWAWNGDGGILNMLSPGFQPFNPAKNATYTPTGYFQTIYGKL